MNQNYNNIPVANTAIKAEDSRKYILYIFIALAIIGCFLPFVTASAYGLEESINYVYAEGSVKDGVYVIALLAMALFQIISKMNYKTARVFIGIALGILAFDFFDIQSNMSELTYYGLVEVNYDIGFYLIAAGLVGALVMTFVIKNNSVPVSPANNVVVNNVMPQPMPQPMVQPQMQVPTACKYCGSPRNEGMFCKYCGGKY